MLLRRLWRSGPLFIAGTRAAASTAAPPAPAATSPRGHAGTAAGGTVDATIVTRRDLAYTLWPPLVVGGRPRIVVLVDSSMPGSNDDLVRELRRDGFAVCWNGDCSRARATPTPPTISAAAQALDVLIHALVDDHRLAVEDVAVVAQGPAALAALTWAHDYAPRVRGLVVASHGLLRASHAPRAMDDDGACAKRVVQDAQAIDLPLLALLSDGANDPLRDTSTAIIGQLSRPTARSVVVAGQPSRGSARQVARDVLREFLRDAFEKPWQRPSLIDADQRGFTKEELDRCLRPLPRFSKRWLRVTFAKASIRVLGPLSRRMRIGLRTGFDSGSSMEDVSANLSSGVTARGRALDASYLRSPGWLAIRVRRRYVQRLIAETSQRIQHEGRELHVVDIAAGHGDAFDGTALAALRPRPTLALACGIYERFPDNACVIASLGGLSRAMEPGGYLLYTNQPYQPRLEFFVRVVPSHRPGQPCVVRRRTQAEMDQLVALAGFTKISQVTDPQGIFNVSVARRIARVASWG